MRLYKRGEIWWCDYGKQGGRRSLETTEKGEATRRARNQASRIWDAANAGIQHIQWATAMMAYLDESQALKSLETAKLRLRWLHQRLDGMWLRDITTGKIEELIAECSKGRAPATVNRVMAALSAVLHLARRREWIDSVPYIRKLAESSSRIRWITPEEAARLLDELPGHLNTMAAFTLATGLRASNVQYLQWSNVSLERRTAWIDAADFKSGRAHTVPLNDPAMTILRGQIGLHHAWVFPYDGHPVEKVSTHAWHRALKRADIQDFRWHDLRHTWASWHVMNGTPLEVLMKLGGWNSLDMVMRYAHLAPGFVARYAQNSHTAIRANYDAEENSSENNGIMGWLMGLEPTTTGITIQDSTN